MNCPYCSKEMKKGKIHFDLRIIPYWIEDGDKRHIEDVFLGKNLLPMQSSGMKRYVESFYCPDCKKMIFDADLQV